MRSSKSLLLTAILAIGATSATAQSDYYKVKPDFIPYPQPGKSWNIRQYGPVGLNINLINPAFTIQVNAVEKGSPAEATGKFKKGQIIESINGQTLKDIDPRVQLADILTEAEATDGVMKFKIKDGETVTVQLPVMGRYSKTWPLNCPKSDKIVRNFAAAIAAYDKPRWEAAPFLMSTGEEQDLQVVARWLKEGNWDGMTYPWHIGYRATAICEYYLRTGDQSVLPGIKKMADSLKGSMYNGSWMGRGSTAPNFKYMAGGHMNAAGVHALNFLLLARQCGVEVDEYLLQRVLFQFFRYAGRGNVAYGDQMPEGGFRDNGKTAGLAVAMSSAAALAPEGENSIYAAARDNSAMKSFYATTWFNRAHTGGGIGEIWHGVAMQLMVDKKPVQHRSFTDARRWFYELSRKHDGTFSISDSGGGYDKPEWGHYFAMLYTAPRKKLRMFGAPKTEFCKTYPLPTRPWGTPADDVYQSIKPAQHEPGKVLDISNELIKTHASGPLMGKLGSEASDGMIWVYAHHPEYAYRSGMARQIVRDGRTKLVMPLLKSKDPRVREVGVLTLAGMFKGSALPVDQITPEMWAVVSQMIEDPNESRWVAINAMKALARGPGEKVLPHVDRLIALMKEDDWWTQSAALGLLSKVAANETVYRKVLPAIGDLAVKNSECATLWGAKDLPGQLSAAKPEVQKFAMQVFTKAYDLMPDPLIAPGGANLATGTKIFKDSVRKWITALPGGSAELSKLPKLSSEWQASRKDTDKYVYSGFSANKAIVGNWRTVDQVRSVKDYEDKLAKEAAQKAKDDAARKAGKKIKKRPPPKPKKYGLAGIALNADGSAAIGRSKMQWSGDKLIKATEVLGMKIHNIGGKDYLFVETGGFSPAHPAEWSPSYYVMTRK